MCKQSEQFKEKILHLKAIKKNKCSSKACLKKEISQRMLPYGNYYQKGLRNTENCQYPVHLKTSVTETERQHV